ncbi:MAG: 50S ribosomal protein L6 [Spirochaetales bacterium]|nr:50S ribosomal protein L6 [Spirochaetales bacterium]MBO4717306.1 50S ribosomal protein L6 [Spirochaetales bacterium]MBR5099089.1 50S ribosomal protein L6 [Spirochaetales bacterium]
MSRIGRLPIDMPKTVKASIANGVITVEGPKGKLSQAISPAINVALEDGKVVVTRDNDEKQTKAYHGLMRQLIRNMIIGVSEGYQKTMVIIGVGYKAELKQNILVLTLGYANDIEYVVPEGVKIACETPTKFSISGIDKQLVGQTAAEIRSLRKPEPYKGKGIRYENEYVRSKSGKSGKK